MRTAVLSDIHANLAALEAVLADASSQSADRIVCLGDLVINGPAPGESFERLAHAAPAVWIKGNTDAWFEEIEGGWKPLTAREESLLRLYEYARARLTEVQIEFLKALPHAETFRVGSCEVLAVHGSPRSFSEGMDDRADAADLRERLRGVVQTAVVCGHTHRACRLTIDGRMVVNVGSVGLPADGDPRASYAILDEIGGELVVELRRVEYDKERALREAEAAGFPGLPEMRRQLETGFFG